MEHQERVMPTHIIAGAGKVLGLIQTPAIIERYKTFLEYTGRPTYLEYVTRPAFQLKLKRLI